MSNPRESSLLAPPSASEGLETQRLRAALRRGLELDERPPDPVRLGRFVVLEQLGEGGMGTVFAAFDPKLDRQVALKILRRDRAIKGTPSRLIEEARTLARVDHPNVVRVFEVDELEGEVVVVMELVKGRSLRAWGATLEREARDWWRPVVDTYADAAAGLIAAHAIGIVHRDFKPANAMRTEEGRVCVLDFGLARRSEGPETDESGRDSERSAVAGTPGYMSPEQRGGLDVDARTDQYAFAVSLCEALTGSRVPTEDQLAKVPTWLRRVVERGRAERPQERYASMTELRHALLDDPQTRRRKLIGRAFAGAIALGAVALAYDAGRTAEPEPCARAGERATNRWTDEARASLKTQFTAAAPSFGEPTAIAVDATLTRTFAAWVAQAEDTCSAHRIREENGETQHALRVACLDRTYRQIDALLSALETADESDIGSSPEAVAHLPDPSRCGDVDSLVRGVVPPPKAFAQDVGRVAESLARARAQHQLGRSADARALVERTLAELPGDQAFEVMRVQLTALLGQIDIADHRVGDAAKHLQASLWAAVRVRDLHTAALASLGLARLQGVTLGRTDDGMAWVERGEAFADAANADAQMLAELALARADIENEREDDEASLRAAARAREFAEASGDQILLASVDRSLGRAERLTGDPKGALERLRGSVEALTARLGKSHPRTFSARHSLVLAWVHADSERGQRERLALIEEARRDLPRNDVLMAEILNSAGIFEIRRARPSDARAYFEEAIRIYDERFGPTSVRSLQTMHGLVRVERDTGSHEAARSRLLRMQRVANEHHPETFRLHLRILAGLAGLAVKTREWEQAESYYRAAIALSTENLVPPHWSFYSNLATVLKKRDDYEGAAEALAATLEIQQDRWGPESAELEPVYVHLGNLDLNRKRWEDAERWFRRALEVAVPVRGTDDPRMAAAHLGVGRALSGAGKPAEAIAHYVAAQAAADNGESVQWHAWTRYNLAMARWDANEDRTEAVALAEEALKIFRDGKHFEKRVRQVERWLDEHRG